MTHVSKTRDLSTDFGLGINRRVPENYGHSTNEATVLSYWLPNMESNFSAKANIFKAQSPDHEKTGKESIAYVNGFRDKWHGCSHYKEQFVILPYAYIKAHYRYKTRYQVSEFGRAKVSSSAIPVSIKAHNVTGLRTAKIRAWLTMQPRYEGELSLINFLWELPDVTHLIRQFINGIRVLRRFVHRRRSARKHSIHSASGDAASAVLTWNLAIQPLISDLHAIWSNLLTAASEAQAAFAKAGLKSDTSYYSEVLSTQDNFSYGTTDSYFWGYGSSTTTKFTAAMEHTYGYNMRNMHQNFMKYWGLNLTPEAIWNGTPFSFCLDYFVKIGDAIRYMSRDKNVKVNVITYSESLKTEKTAGTHLSPRSSFSASNEETLINGQLGSTGLVTGYVAKLYERHLTSPTSGLYIPKVKTASDKQKLNLICLIRSALM